MSNSGVDGSDMSGIWLDDDSIEALVDGDSVDPRFGPLVGFAQAVRALGDGPAPAASPALEAAFVAGPEPGVLHRTRRNVLNNGFRTASAKVTALGVIAKIVLGAALATVGLAGAGAAGTLPGRMDDKVRRAIEAVMPVDFEDPAAGDGPARFGERVSSDATGAADGDNGVDGQTISDQAPGSAHRPADPGQHGHDRASQTPAAEHLPDRAGNERGGAAPAAPNGSTSTVPSEAPPAASTVPSTVPSEAPPAASTVPSTVPPRENRDR